MAFVGYGPVQSLLMWDDAMAFKPRVVIEAFYTGNDPYDCFNHVYNLNRLPEYQSEDAELHQRAMDAKRRSRYKIDFGGYAESAYPMNRLLFRCRRNRNRGKFPKGVCR